MRNYIEDEIARVKKLFVPMLVPIKMNLVYFLSCRESRTANRCSDFWNGAHNPHRFPISSSILPWVFTYNPYLLCTQSYFLAVFQPPANSQSGSSEPEQKTSLLLI